LLGPFEQRTGGIINSRRSFQHMGDPKTRMWHEPPDWVVGSATGVPSLRVWDDAITPEQIQEEWTAWNGSDWIYVNLLVLDGEDGRYTWQEQVEAPQRALKAAAARVFVTGRPPRGQHASKLGPFVRRGAEGSTEAGGDVPLVGGRHSYEHAADASVVMWHAAPPSGAAGRWWIGQRKDLAQRRGFIYAVSEAYTPEAIEASARWMVFQPRAKAWREWPPGRDGPRCQAGDEGRKAWDFQQQQQEKYAAASDSGGGRCGGRGGGGGGGGAGSSCDASTPPPPSTPPQPRPEPTWAPRVSGACAGAPDDEEACLEAVTSLQRTLSAEIASSVEIAISEIGALADLLRLMEHSREELVLQALWCVTNFASASSAETRQLLVVPDALSRLGALLGHASAAVQLQAAWAVANLAAHPPAPPASVRLLAASVLEPLLSMMKLGPAPAPPAAAAAWRGAAAAAAAEAAAEAAAAAAVAAVAAAMAAGGAAAGSVARARAASSSGVPAEGGGVEPRHARAAVAAWAIRNLARGPPAPCPDAALWPSHTLAAIRALLEQDESPALAAEACWVLSSCFTSDGPTLRTLFDAPAMRTVATRLVALLRRPDSSVSRATQDCALSVLGDVVGSSRSADSRAALEAGLHESTRAPRPAP